MTRLDCPLARYHVQADPQQLHITIPSPRPRAALLFLLFWLLGWSLGELLVLAMLLTAVLPSPLHTFITVVPPYPPWTDLVSVGIWFVAWTLAGSSAWYLFIWYLSGWETIQLSRTTLTIRQHMDWRTMARHYPLAAITDLRVAPRSFPIRGFAAPDVSPPLGGRYGTLAGQVGDGPIRFGSGLTPSEAHAVLHTIQTWRVTADE